MDHHRLFSDKSKVYANARPTYPKALYEFIVSVVPAKLLAWDCACGNGQAAIDLAGLFDHVHATDVSPEQIANAKPRANVNYHVAPSENGGLADQSCDLICVAQALHWFDFDAFWPEALRVLKPDGVFAAWGYNWPILEDELAGIFKEDVLDVIEPYWAEQNKLLWNHYRDLSFPFHRLAAPTPEMNVNHNFHEFVNFIKTFSAVQRCIQANGDAFFKQACDKLEKVWGNPERDKTIAFDFVLYVGRKNA